MKADGKLIRHIPTSRTAVSVVSRACIYVLLIDLSFVFLYPVLYMFVTSFKSYADLNNPIVTWIPRNFTPENWKVAFETLEYLPTFLRTSMVVLASTLGHVLSCAFIGYGFARFRFKTFDRLFLLVILTIIIPLQTFAVPAYLTFTKLGWIDTYLPIIIPSFFGFGLRGGVFILIFRQCFLKMPKSLEEAAAIDGCGPFRTFFRIALRTASNNILVVTVLSIVWHWNDYIEPNLYIARIQNYLLPQKLPELSDLIQVIASSLDVEQAKLKVLFNDAVVMAGTALAVLPLLILYGVLQRRFMQSVERSGLVE